MIDSFEVPKDLLSKLPLLTKLLRDRDSALQAGLTFDILLEEMQNALTDFTQIPEESDRIVIEGPNWIDSTALIYENVRIEGPCIICKKAVIGPGAYIRPGSVIGPYAKIGFGAEIKATVVGSHSKIVHQAYIGNSIIENNVEVSASVVMSAKRFDLKPITTFTRLGDSFPTSLVKLGSWVGENARIGSGALLMPGSVIGKSAIVFPNETVIGFVAPEEIVRKSEHSRFEAAKLLTESHYREDDLYWRRNNVFVTITGALFALFAVLSRLENGFTFEVTTTLSIFGLVVSLAWVQVSRMSKFYCVRIETDLQELVKGDRELSLWFKTWSLKRIAKRPKGPRATTTVRIVAWISVLLWTVIGVYGGTNIYSKYSANITSSGEKKTTTKDSDISVSGNGPVVLQDNNSDSMSVNGTQEKDQKNPEIKRDPNERRD